MEQKEKRDLKKKKIQLVILCLSLLICSVDSATLFRYKQQKNCYDKLFSLQFSRGSPTPRGNPRGQDTVAMRISTCVFCSHTNQHHVPSLAHGLQCFRRRCQICRYNLRFDYENVEVFVQHDDLSTGLGGPKSINFRTLRSLKKKLLFIYLLIRVLLSIIKHLTVKTLFLTKLFRGDQLSAW